MAANKLQWKRIAKGDKLPCQSFLRKKDGEILKLSTGAGVTVGQDAYYLPIDDVIEGIKNYPIEESEDEKIKQELIEYHKAQAFLDGKTNNKHVKFVAWLEKQGEQKPVDEAKTKFKIGDIIKPKCYNETHLIKAIKECYYILDVDIKIPFRDEDYWELVEQKPAWSEEDEKVLDNIFYILNQLKDTTPYKEDKTAKECIDKLKSLKERYTWKPSEGQMNNK